MSSSGLIYAVIVGAWAAYLVPMWLRRQDELNEARPTERFSTAIRLLSGRAGMERRYAKDLQTRSPEGEEQRSDPSVPDAATDSVDVRAFAAPPVRGERRNENRDARHERHPGSESRPEPRPRTSPARQAPDRQVSARTPHDQQAHDRPNRDRPANDTHTNGRSATGRPGPDRQQSDRQPSDRSAAERQAASADAAARARRSKVLARRRRTTVMLFLAFTAGAVVAAVGGLAFLWAPAVPAVLLSSYIFYLRAQERRRFAYTMDRRQAEVAAQRLRERQPRRRQPAAGRAAAEEAEEGPAPEVETDPGLEALAADRRALVEQTDHAEWVDQQRERQRRPGHGDSWDPVPVPLPTYVTAPVAPRAAGSVDLGAPDAWSSARSSTAGAAQQEPDRHTGEEPAAASEECDGADGIGDERCDARRAASARRSRERGRTPLFDQYDDGGRPRAANE
ncbi:MULTISPECIES: divisome protein SepX/GlpR [Streptomyces]|uniref:divisome protein SepX/GlpR n=1 Tax=Streptomyces TaxID=1883 RepID=UPI002E17DB9A|nr:MULTISPECIES: gephyrin-like molybdotransferase receptor GlpR [unclassified Streptomyces]